MQIPLENLRNKLMIALHIHVTRCKASQLLMASSCTSLQTLPSKSISNLIITIDTYLAPRYLRWLSKVPKRGNTASHSNWIRCFYRSLMRIPFACFVQEPYLNSEAGFRGEGLERNVGMVLLFRVNICFCSFLK